MSPIKSMTRAWAEIDLAAIRQNFTAVKAHADAHKCRVAAVVKANGYGHGAVRVAEELENRCGADFFAVATLPEAMELADAGIKSPILLLSEIHPSLYGDLVRYGNVIPSVFRLESAKELSHAAQSANRELKYFIVLDTGMSRIGLECTSQKKAADSLGEIKKITSLPGIKLEGIFSHYARADEADKTSALAQADCFDRFIAMLGSEGITAPVLSMCNSAALTEPTIKNKYDLVRPGISLYGLDPSEDTERILHLKPALALRARVTSVRVLDENTGVSYGHTYVTDRKTAVATIPVGYADGYPRLLSNKAGVIIDDKYAPIIGRVCMDQMMVDVTDIPSAKEGSIATLMGADKRVRADRLASLIGTIPYELICGVSPRIPRIYTNSYSCINSD